MAKNSIRDFDATSSNNTDIQSVDISEGCSPAGINNAIRELMADIKDVSAGTVALESPSADSLTVTGDLTVDTNTLFVDASENAVGIGLTDPDTPLEIRRSSSGNALKLSSSTDGASVFLAFEHQESGTKHVRGRIRAASNGVNGGLIFETGASSSTSERVRIDNDGTFLVGKTSANTSVAGIEARSVGLLVATRDGGQPLLIDRLTDDGDLILFRQDGSTVGSIKCRSSGGNLQINTGQSGIDFGGDGYLPMRNGSIVDNNLDIGSSSYRYDDIFATNGTIQTSDQNEKQQIASLTDAEINAAKAISKLFKTFKWNDKVEAKGDNARTHAGVIAQDVSSAMTDAGLDATKYAFFCSDTWWEHSVEVPAVEADEENGIEAQDAYTRVDPYYTADEAPEGATQHTRLGIRYPELLAFIGAATEQRLTHLETLEARIEALENA